MQIESKKTGSALTATEFNQIPNELENLITKSGQTASSSDLNQVAKAVTQMVGDANFYATSGTANAIVLSAISPRVAPIALTDGLQVRFKATATNTGAVTVNLAGLGAKKITNNGNELTAGLIEQNNIYDIIYSSQDDNFNLKIFEGNKYALKSGDTFTGVVEIAPTNVDLSNYNKGLLVLKDENMDFTETVTTPKYSRLIFQDVNGERTGCFEVTHQPTQKTAKMTIYNQSTYADIEVGLDSSKNSWTKAPTPPASNKSTQIATTEWIWANATWMPFPSTKYVNLTLNASGSSYTAPATGWFMIDLISARSGDILNCDTNTSLCTSSYATQAKQGLKVFFPMLKGHKISISYTSGMTKEVFRFIYALGAN